MSVFHNHSFHIIVRVQAFIGLCMAMIFICKTNNVYAFNTTTYGYSVSDGNGDYHYYEFSTNLSPLHSLDNSIQYFNSQYSNINSYYNLYYSYDNDNQILENILTEYVCDYLDNMNPINPDFYINVILQGFNFRYQSSQLWFFFTKNNICDYDIDTHYFNSSPFLGGTFNLFKGDIVNSDTYLFPGSFIYNTDPSYFTNNQASSYTITNTGSNYISCTAELFNTAFDLFINGNDEYLFFKVERVTSGLSYIICRNFSPTTYLTYCYPIIVQSNIYSKDEYCNISGLATVDDLKYVVAYSSDTFGLEFSPFYYIAEPYSINTTLPTPTPIPTFSVPFTPTPFPTNIFNPTVTPINLPLNPIIQIGDYGKPWDFISGIIPILHSALNSGTVHLFVQTIEYIYNTSLFFEVILFLIPSICLLAFILGRLKRK